MYAIIIASLWIIPAVAVVTTHRAASGKLARNHVVGIRTPSTMASDDAWRAGHRAAIPIMWLTVPVALAGSAWAMTNAGSPRELHSVLWVSSALLILVVIAAAVVAARAARRVNRG